MNPSISHKTWAILLLASSLALVLLGFGWQRISSLEAFRDPKWPRPFPYPDRLLYRLERYYDAKYPAPPDSIKIHGEFPRVQFALLWSAIPPLVALLVSGVVVGIAAIRSSRLTRRLLVLAMFLSGAQLAIAYAWRSATFPWLLAQLATGYALGCVAWYAVDWLTRQTSVYRSAG